VSRTFTFTLAFAIGTTSALGCTGATARDDAAVVDDAGRDAALVADGGHDAGPAGSDSGSDASPDAGNDADVRDAWAGDAGACAAGTYDDDGDPFTPCVAWTQCAAGQHVASAGTATTNRTCVACETATFSTTTNAVSCTAWRTCDPTERELTPGTPTSDRICTSAAWTRQFGSTNADGVDGLAVDASGNVLVAGHVVGVLPGQTNAGNYDAYVRKYAPDGTALWTHELGTIGSDSAYAVTSDSSANVFVVGRAASALPMQTSAGGYDAFVRAYSPDGAELWTRQFGTSSDDEAHAVSTDGSGNVYVAGCVVGALPGQSAVGNDDAFVRVYAADGTVTWTRQFGSSALDCVSGVSVGADGSVYVVGYTDGALPGQTLVGMRDAFVRAYTADGTERWTRQFGTSITTRASAVVVNASGVYVAGDAYGALPGQTAINVADAYLRKYGADGTELWTRQFGSMGTDVGYAVGADASGLVYVFGNTDGALPGQTSLGAIDGFARTYAADGTAISTWQLGTPNADYAVAGAVAAAGAAYLGGYTYGTLPGQTRVGDLDSFIVRVAP